MRKSVTENWLEWLNSMSKGSFVTMEIFESHFLTFIRNECSWNKQKYYLFLFLNFFIRWETFLNGFQTRGIACWHWEFVDLVISPRRWFYNAFCLIWVTVFIVMHPASAETQINSHANVVRANEPLHYRIWSCNADTDCSVNVRPSRFSIHPWEFISWF